MVAHFWWATWAIRSLSLICLERFERIAHSRSFDLSDERMSKFPALHAVRSTAQPLCCTLWHSVGLSAVRFSSLRYLGKNQNNRQNCLNLLKRWFMKKRPNYGVMTCTVSLKKVQTPHFSFVPKKNSLSLIMPPLGIPQFWVWSLFIRLISLNLINPSTYVVYLIFTNKKRLICFQALPPTTQPETTTTATTGSSA